MHPLSPFASPRGEGFRETLPPILRPAHPPLMNPIPGSYGADGGFFEYLVIRYVMSKSSLALSSVPPQALTALQTLGEHLAVARLRRRESQRQWAARLGVSLPTLIRLEKGEPSVSMGVYASALWLLGLSSGLADLADPAKDLRALESDIHQASQVRAARARSSRGAQFGKKKEG